MSSRSPGCSPTSITSADSGPSPKTVWVAVSQRTQALQPAANSRSSAIDTTVATAVTYPVRSDPNRKRLCCHTPYKGFRNPTGHPLFAFAALLPGDLLAAHGHDNDTARAA